MRNCDALRLFEKYVYFSNNGGYHKRIVLKKQPKPAIFDDFVKRYIMN